MRYPQAGYITANRLCNRLCGLGVGLRKKDRELFSAIAGHSVARPIHLGANRSRDHPQAIIPNQMSVRIIEPFEMIRIEQNQRKG